MNNNSYELEYECEDLKLKIDEICEKEKLQLDWNMAKFPIVATVKPLDKDKNQVEMDLGPVEKNRNGELRFIFGDDLQIKIDDDFYIPNEFFNKLKNSLKKLHYLHLQVFFKNRVEK